MTASIHAFTNHSTLSSQWRKYRVMSSHFLLIHVRESNTPPFLGFNVTLRADDYRARHISNRDLLMRSRNMNSLSAEIVGAVAEVSKTLPISPYVKLALASIEMFAVILEGLRRMTRVYSAPHWYCICMLSHSPVIGRTLKLSRREAYPDPGDILLGT